MISVIVPVYNAENYLDRCIASICGQSYKNLEIILVDDGSSDSSSDKCDQWKAKDSRICVIHKENEGLSSARNAGIEKSQGAYIAFVDADDAIHENFIEILYQLCEDNMCQIAQCDFLYVEEGYPKLPICSQQETIVISNREALRNCCMGADFVKFNVAWNKLYKKELFSEIRYPLGKLHEDEFITYQIFWKASRIIVTSEYLYYYLQHSGSIMGDKYNIKHLDRLEALQERANRLKENRLFDEYASTIIRYYYDIWNAWDKIEFFDQAEVERRSLRTFLQEESKKLEAEIVNLPGHSYLDNLAVVYPHLSTKEKEELKKKYGAHLEAPGVEQYVFPFQALPKNAKIALYGAGLVGKIFSMQLQATRFCEVVLWVDNRWFSFDKAYHIQPVYRLLEADYEFVVIAIKDKRVAESIRKRLIAWGINNRKIVWENPTVCRNIR